MATQIINEEAFVAHLRNSMNKEMMEAAEPVIKEAVAKAEDEIRKRLGEMVVGMIATQYSVCRDGRDIMIRVLMDPKDGGLR